MSTNQKHFVKPSAFKSPVFQPPSRYLIEKPHSFREAPESQTLLGTGSMTGNSLPPEQDHSNSTKVRTTSAPPIPGSTSTKKPVDSQDRTTPYPRPPTNPNLFLHRPLPISKIHSLKSAYDTFQTTIGDPLDHGGQIRLSCALSYDFSRHILDSTAALLSTLPFARSSTIIPAQTSWVDHRAIREARLAERKAKSSALDSTRARWAEEVAGVAIPTIVRCGGKGSGLPILVRWTDGCGDSYVFYDEGEKMPREVRRLLFAEWKEEDRPFGREGVDWQIDEVGRVWLRDRKREIDVWGRRWLLQC